MLRSEALYEPEPNSGCWLWAGAAMMTRSGPYGQWSRVEPGRSRLAHRHFYEEANGPIPAGLEIDHLCRNTLCVNPRHLEPVPHQVNIARGKRGRPPRWTHCGQGHEFTQENTIKNGKTRTGAEARVCRACRIAYRKRAA